MMAQTQQLTEYDQRHHHPLPSPADCSPSGQYQPDPRSQAGDARATQQQDVHQSEDGLQIYGVGGRVPRVRR